MVLGCTVEWNYVTEDGLYGSDNVSCQTIEEVNALVEKIKAEPHKKVLNCWITTVEKII